MKIEFDLFKPKKYIGDYPKNKCKEFNDKNNKNIDEDGNQISVCYCYYLFCLMSKSEDNKKNDFNLVPP